MTGGNIAAEITLPAHLVLKSYNVDLACAVSKYIGETEKNLDRIFANVESADTVLSFDEGGALFDERPPVRASRDRYTDIKVSYQL